VTSDYRFETSKHTLYANEVGTYKAMPIWLLPLLDLPLGRVVQGMNYALQTAEMSIDLRLIKIVIIR